MSWRKLELGIDEINSDEIITKRFCYCQNKLCGVGNTIINGKYCSKMCADYDVGAFSGREWLNAIQILD